ncbi:MAG: RNA methyltransferase [Polyangiaceae bacterium]|jgi:23S rRNA G2445 N2-methylase RlmL|nr:RNA methyltransferase [Polyangiaceae bacterium]MBK8939268.1 RNA methyltransferase [Polyangiaceae bacterium]
MQAFFATAAKGTEGAVRDELRSLRFRGVRADRGGVHFSGELSEGARACVELRTPMRVLVQLARFDAPSEDALYEGVRRVAWEEHLTAKTTLAVRASTRSSALTHSRYVAQKAKDAIVDRLRERLGARPDVDLEDPDAVVSVHLAKDLATLYLDLSGQPLFLRGYRTEHHGAPLKETLAASLLFVGGWATDRDAFIDPMCGSGTIAIEAALLAEGRAPGTISERRFGFERWASFNTSARAALAQLKERAAERAERARRAPRPPIWGFDVDGGAVEIARANARRAGVDVRFDRRDARDLRLAEPTTLVTNPPYGERISMTEAAWREAAAALTRDPDARVGLILGHPDMLRAIRTRPNKVITMMNGDLECGFAMFGRPARAT